MLRIEGRGEEMCLRKRGMIDGISMGQIGERQKGGMDGGNCELVCEEIVAPVCDSQGRTHKNRCKLARGENIFNLFCTNVKIQFE